MSVDSRSDLVDEVPSLSDDGSSSIELPLLSDSEDEGQETEINGDKVPVVASKARSIVDQRLNDANNAYIKNMFRSADLVYLEADFETFKKHLKRLLSTAKVYNVATEERELARTKLFGGFSELATKTPLQPFINEGKGSLAAIQHAATMYQAYNTQEYSQQILGYINDWQNAVSAHVKAKTSVLPKLKRRREHYARKLETLRGRIERLETPEKAAPKAVQERLERTEVKLSQALTAHEDAACRACFLLDQIMNYAWKDLYPLVSKTIKWELNKLGREERTYGELLPSTIEQLEQKGLTEMEATTTPTVGEYFEGTQSIYGNVEAISDYMDYLPPNLPHLFLDDACPFSQCTWIAFLEKESDPQNPTLFQLHRVCSFLGTRDPGCRILNELGLEDDEIPVLIHNGSVFKDSYAVSEYIDGCFEKEGNSLSPADPVGAFNMSLFVDRHAAISELYFQILESDSGNTSFSDLILQLEKLLEEIDTDLQKIPGHYLCGNQFTLADIFIFPFVERIQVVLSHYYQIEIDSSLSSLHTWYAKVSSRKSVQITMADRSAASISTCVMENTTRKDYLVEYYEPYVRNEVALAKDIFQMYGFAGENAYRERNNENEW
eukprot:scaffold14515_cov97-Cylindrotheca_fusiformis.AAC.4